MRLDAAVAVGRSEAAAHRGRLVAARNVFSVSEQWSPNARMALWIDSAIPTVSVPVAAAAAVTGLVHPVG